MKLTSQTHKRHTKQLPTSSTRKGETMIRWLWWIVAALHAVMLVGDIMAGAPTFEHEALMMLALVLVKIDAMNEGW